jgi:hypothetical protein
LYSKIRLDDIIRPLAGHTRIGGVSRLNGCKEGTRMKAMIAIAALSLALMSSTAMAEERASDAVSVVVRRPIGAVAGAVHRLFGAHQPRSSVARREQRVPPGESQPGSTPPAPQDKAAAQTAAPAQRSTTTTASTMPPVQPLE